MVSSPYAVKLVAIHKILQNGISFHHILASWYLPPSSNYCICVNSNLKKGSPVFLPSLFKKNKSTIYTLFIDFVSVKTSFLKNTKKVRGYSLLICIAGVLNLLWLAVMITEIKSCTVIFCLDNRLTLIMVIIY